MGDDPVVEVGAVEDRGGGPYLREERVRVGKVRILKWIVPPGETNLDANGNVEAVIDAEFVHQFYLAACREKGVPNPPVILGAH